MNQNPNLILIKPPQRTYLLVTLAAVGWILAYSLVQPLADWVAYDLLGLEDGSRLGEAAAFFATMCQKSSCY